MDIVGDSSARGVPLLQGVVPNGTGGADSVPSRDLGLARQAYLRKDPESSRQAHAARAVCTPYHLERHVGASSDYLKALVFGGLDGIVTIFAIVAGCVGAHLTPAQTMIVGFGNVLADAVAMGFGEYVSASTEDDFLDSEKAREVWEVENFPEGEKQEMMEIYEYKYKFTPEDARAMVDISFKYKDFCISHMMAEELGLLCSSDGPSPLQRGAAMFSAFVIFGLVPLSGFGIWSYVTNGFMPASEGQQNVLAAFWSAAVFSCITLFILGGIKATFISRNPYKSGLQVMLNGAFAGGVAYGVGVLLQHIIGNGAGPVG